MEPSSSLLICTATVALAQPVINVPPDPFPAQPFLDANPSTEINLVGPVDLFGFPAVPSPGPAFAVGWGIGFAGTRRTRSHTA